MAETLHPCCEQAKRTYLARIDRAIISYPVIKTIPCPTCRRVIPIRVYEPGTTESLNH